jgi:hypothetical protein
MRSVRLGIAELRPPSAAVSFRGNRLKRLTESGRDGVGTPRGAAGTFGAVFPDDEQLRAFLFDSAARFSLDSGL